MDFEQGKFAQEEQKNHEKTEAEQKLEIEKRLVYAKEHNELMARIEKDKKLIFLKSLIERNLIQPETAEKIVANESLNVVELEDIFEKIDAIDSEENIDSILPSELRINKEEYLQALENNEGKVLLLQKIHTALRYIDLRSRGHSHAGIAIFKAFFKLLNRNLEAGIIRVKQNLLILQKSLNK